jgi:hypothetical protein
MQVFVQIIKEVGAKIKRKKNLEKSKQKKYKDLPHQQNSFS